MSAFLCIFDRSGAAVAPELLDRLAETLDLHGSERSARCQGPIGLATRRSPGSIEGYGPGVDPDSGRLVAAAGHFGFTDRREEPLAALRALVPGELSAGTRRALEQDDLETLAALAGPFVLVTADPGPGSPWVRLTRDHLGSLTLYYYLDPRWLIAATEPEAILRHPAVSGDLDEVAAARFLGFRFDHDPRSFFRHLRQVPPAHRLEVTATEARCDRYWSFRRLRVPANGAEGAIPAEYRERVAAALSLELAGRDPQRLALSLSGGLDSAALAALAPSGTRAYSWFFDATPECDERPRLEAISRHLGLVVRQICGDHLDFSSEGFAERFVHPSSPYVNAFSALKARLYQEARDQGCTCIMVGDAGDALYAAQGYWLRDAVASRRPGSLTSLAATVRAALRGDPHARWALRLLLPLEGLRRWIPHRPPPWLTAAGRALLPPLAPPRARPEDSWRRHELAAGAKHTELESEERRLFAQCGVDRANPYWHWPLLEWVLALPAYWFREGERSKVLTREAFRGVLPQTVLEGGRVGTLGSVFLRGIEGQRPAIRELVFRHPRSDWQRYVRRSWVEPYLDATDSIQLGHTILWRVISYELWQRRLIDPGRLWATPK